MNQMNIDVKEKNRRNLRLIVGLLELNEGLDESVEILNLANLLIKTEARKEIKGITTEVLTPYEVAETSAVGRALGFAGYGATDSIASADEVNKAANVEEVPDPTEDWDKDFPDKEDKKVCSKCESETNFRSGTNAAGKKYAGNFCQNTECKNVDWINVLKVFPSIR